MEKNARAESLQNAHTEQNDDSPSNREFLCMGMLEGNCMRRDLKVRHLVPNDISSCERILHALPSWFGIEKANEAYIRSLSSLPAYVAVIDDEVVGFHCGQLCTTVFLARYMCWRSNLVYIGKEWVRH